MPVRERVVVAMSGGVDSSVAALLLSKQGYEVIGLTADLLGQIGGSGKCCSISMTEDARRVCNALGIPHYVINLRELFKREIIDYFSREFLSGRTPNPCIECNRTIKFKEMLRFARGLGASLLATGHYARVEFEEGRPYLRKGKDSSKDQSYFLYVTPREELGNIRFPVGDFEKNEVRDIAEENGFANARKEDSQDLCFITGPYDRDYHINRYLGDNKDSFRPGVIQDLNGKQLGTHDGIHNFTVGQRVGIGKGSGERLYVTAMAPATGTVTVAAATSHEVSSIILSETNILAPELLVKAQPYELKTRYRQEFIKGIPFPEGDRVRIQLLDKNVFISPGQSAVLYADETVVLGGKIESVLRE